MDVVFGQVKNTTCVVCNVVGSGKEKKGRGTSFVDSEGRRVRITAGYVSGNFWGQYTALAANSHLVLASGIKDRDSKPNLIQAPQNEDLHLWQCHHFWGQYTALADEPPNDRHGI